MGRLREVCGAVSGMFLVLGLQYPANDIKDKAAKNLNYKMVQKTAKTFKTEMGTPKFRIIRAKRSLLHIPSLYTLRNCCSRNCGERDFKVKNER